jgi:lipoate-protein ligase A
MNMALDEALLALADTGATLLRCYSWSEPACSFGYSQRWSELPMTANSGVRWVRRITGGGVVDHRDDFTYALGWGPHSPWYRCEANTIYKEVHECIARAIRQHGIAAELAPCTRGCDAPKQANRIATACFSSAEPLDVICPLSGAKLACAAMKRDRRGLLLQGSISMRQLAVAKADLEAALHSCLATVFGAIEPAPWAALQAAAGPLEDRYLSDRWNQRR